MKIKNYNKSFFIKNNKKSVVLLAILLLIAVVIVVTFVLINRNKPHNPQSDPSPAEESAALETTDKREPNEPTENQKEQIRQRVPLDSTYAVSILDVNKVGDIVAANAVIDSQKPGKCVFSFTSEGGKPVVREVHSKGSDGPQRCTVTVPTAEFDLLGTWHLTVTYYIDNTRTEATKDVVIN